ncbi:MAG: acid phosphatase [Polyangiaceae bacterium]|nr:acid phosphatase [Polyangiaceae bacterium]
MRTGRFGQRSVVVGLCCALALAACSDDDDGTGGSGATGGGGSTTSQTSDGAGPANGGAPATGGEAATGGAPTGGQGGAGGSGQGGEGGGAPGGFLRFVALGDAGEGNERQNKVADVIKTVCDARGGCDFALYTGDNLYPSGADSADDPQFQTKFEQPYSELDFQFHVVLGNHDYGGDGAGFEFDKAQNEISYSQASTKWSLPSRYYSMKSPEDLIGPSAEFFMLDTNYILFTGDSEQQDWLDGAIAASNKHWKIGVGHHPYVSNGPHGNAGAYDGLPDWFPVASGANVKDFFDDSVCNKMDVYICGHDHDRQWLNPNCGIEFIVTGAGAKMTDLEGDNPTFYEDDQKGGFLLVELTETTFTGTFYDEDGVMNFTRTVTKP